MIASTEERRQTQEAFHKQCETATVVTGRLAHDFGNILTGILGFAELSLTELAPDSPARRYIEEIVNSAQNGAGWIHKLQAFSRRSKPRFLPIPLAPLVAKEEERLRQTWGNRVTFLFSLPEDLPFLAIDADSLRQLLCQLLDNAGEAVSDRGVVTLTAQTVDLCEDVCSDLIGAAQAGRHVVITITDSGTGLSPEIRQRLFRELFVSTKARRRGLGLALVHGILHTFKGGLCFGPDPEQGTRVRLFLPVGQKENSAQTPLSLASTGTRRILVVADDPVVLRMICQVLADAGFEVQAAAGPQEAIALCQAPVPPFGLIVSDIIMPSMNGFEMVRHLQAQNSAVNVLFISSRPSNGLAADALLNQFPLLQKPFATHELVQATAAALARFPETPGGQPLTPCV
jgi:nitrogen-specific signal transduction histidine kinase/ActR/RegA family two-component response regulator